MSSSVFNRVKKIYLYDCPASSTLEISEIRADLIDMIPGTDVEVRKDFIAHHSGQNGLEELAKKMAYNRVRSMKKGKKATEPLPLEIQLEERLLTGKTSVIGILYDGFELQRTFRDLLPAAELDLGIVHIIFTGRLFATAGNDDPRYHARVIILGFPAIISTSGIVEAPARPREFYRLKQLYSSMGTYELKKKELEDDFSGRFIDYDDRRMTEVMKGYVLQAIFYQMTGEAFCRSPLCRLYDAHWQEEVITTQMESGKLCDHHEKILKCIK